LTTELDLVDEWMDRWLGVKPGARDCLAEFKKHLGMQQNSI
jgi:hypothetical protein